MPPVLPRALATCGLTVVLATASTAAWADSRPQPRNAGSNLTNTVTSTSNTNCVNGTEAGCTTSTLVTAAPPAVKPGPYPLDGPIEGTGTAGDTVTIKDGAGNTVCAATVPADGIWSCTPSNPLGPGTVPLTPIDTTISPNVPGQTTDVTFETPPAAPSPLADPGIAVATLAALAGAFGLLRRLRSPRLGVGS